MALIDIIVPIYNVEKYVEKTLSSLSKQSLSDIRVLCIDDGSSDNSKGVVLSFCEKDSRFSYFHKENGGLSSARNFGLEKVEAPYVMFIDGDDFCEVDMAKACYEELINSDSDIVIFNYYQYYLVDNKQEEIISPIKPGVYSLEKNPEILFLTANAAWNKCYKTSLFKDNNIIYPLGYRHQDFGTTPKLLALAKKVSYLAKPYYNYLIDRPNNITGQIDKKLTHILAMSEEIINWYLAKGLFNKYQKYLAQLIWLNYQSSLRKVVKINDYKFVNKFIDTIFNSYEVHFKGIKLRTSVDKYDFIYNRRYLCKLYAYYLYLRRKK